MHCRLASNQVESMRKHIVAIAELMVEHLVARVQETEPTLEGLEEAVLTELHTVGNVTLATLVSALAPTYAPPTSICTCGGEARYVKRRPVQCKTLLGVIHITRPYYLCESCHHGHFPLDQELGLCAGGISAGLEALMVLLGAEFTYDRTAALVEKLSLVSVSASRCREATIALGNLLAQHEETARQEVWEQQQEPPTAEPAQAVEPLYVSADGVMVHTRESGWREQCVGAVYTTAPVRASGRSGVSHRRTSHPDRPTDIGACSLRSRAHSYVSDLGSRANFSQLLWIEAHRRGVEQAKTIVFIGDGARWLWQAAEDLFPKAIQILDWYHASSYVWKVAQALHPAEEGARTQWVDVQLAALWQSRTAEVIATLQPLAERYSAAQDTVTYFTSNLQRMDYQAYRNQGLQVGSGTIESTCKHVIQARITQAGMRWCVHNARTMGKLRTRLKSNRWEETLALRPKPARSYHRRTA